MKEEKWKDAVHEIARSPRSGVTDSIVQKAIQSDTAEGYHRALVEIVTKRDMYAHPNFVAEEALKEK